MQQTLITKITDLGDPTLLLLGGMGLFFYLWNSADRHELACPWAMAFGLCILLTVVSKVVFYVFGGSEPPVLRVHSPSGHVAIGTGFYGGCAMLLASGRGPGARVLAWVGTSALVGILAASRIMLGLHTLQETLAAIGIGGFSLVVLERWLRNRRPILLNAGQVISLLLLIGVAHHCHVNGEALIAQFARHLTGSGSGEAKGVAQGMQDGAFARGAVAAHGVVGAIRVEEMPPALALPCHRLPGP